MEKLTKILQKFQAGFISLEDAETEVLGLFGVIDQRARKAVEQTPSDSTEEPTSNRCMNQQDIRIVKERLKKLRDCYIELMELEEYKKFCQINSGSILFGRIQNLSSACRLAADLMEDIVWEVPYRVVPLTLTSCTPEGPDKLDRFMFFLSLSGKQLDEPLTPDTLTTKYGEFQKKEMLKTNRT